MHEKYKKRCLYKTLSFLIDLQIPCKPIELSEKDIQIDTFFNKREFSQVKNIVCQRYCSCCTVENKFALFYSQIIQNKLLNLESQVITNESDPFCTYIEAVQTKNPSVSDLLQILLQEPYFFEAFEVVLYATTRENIYVIEREINKIEDTILKRIYFMLIYVCKSIKCQNFDNHFTKLLEYFGVGNASYLMSEKENSINEFYKMNYGKYKTLIPYSRDNLYMQALIAAVYYIKKDNEKAQNIFIRIKDKTHHFMDLYSNMLYVKNDTVGLAALALHMSTVHVYKPETYGVLGNYYSLLKDNTNAIKYFEKAIKVDSRCYTNYTLIAYEYTSMEKYNVAIDNFNRALKHNKNDYRALFGLAELYKSLKMYGISMILYKRAAEVHSDNGYCWLSFGIILIRLERYDDAVHALERSISLGEKDALLKLGDCYKKMKRFDEAVGMYEQYVEKQKDPRMIKFLQDYHRKANNVEKAEYYTNLQ